MTTLKIQDTQPTSGLISNTSIHLHQSGLPGSLNLYAQSRRANIHY